MPASPPRRLTSVREAVRTQSHVMTRLLRDILFWRRVATAGSPAGRRALHDTHGRLHDYLRISLTERCNLRCQYCMPAGGATLSKREKLLSVDELMRLVRVFAALGVHKVRLTGGEPTLRADLPELISAIKDVPGIRTLAITTNGIALTRRLPALQRAGLDALNLSLDSLRPDRYERMARRPGLQRVLAALDLALQLGYSPVKINTVLIRGFNDDEVCDFVELTRERDVHVRFIEFMPFGGNEWREDAMVPEREALRSAAARFELEPEPARPGDTARLWTVRGHSGRLGFISSMSRPFCAGCNRLRLTADGSLKVCLFGSAEVSLRDAVRAGASDDELSRLVAAALGRKSAAHAGNYSLPRLPLSRVRRASVPGQYSIIACRRHAAAGRLSQPAHGADRRLAGVSAGARGCSTLSHVDAGGRARMVDVGDKAVTTRRALAECRVTVSPELLRLLRDNALRKGDALAVAQVAGVLAAKRTADLLPLCHALPLDVARVRVELPEEGAPPCLLVRCEVRATARTGAEMEALCGAALAALAIYDMGKAVDRSIRIDGLRLLTKSGGKADYHAPDLPTDESIPGTNK